MGRPKGSKTLAPRPFDEGGEGPRQITIQTPPVSRKEKPRQPITRDEAHIALGMRVAGFPTKKIAKALGSSSQGVSAALQRVPNLWERLNIYRDNLKLRKMERLFDTEEILWNRIEQEIPNGAAKDVDALFRAAHAAEKIEAGLAGESQKVEVTTDSTSHQDLRVLIQTLGLDGWDVVMKP